MNENSKEFEIRIKQKSLDKEKMVFVGNQIPEYLSLNILDKYAGNALYLIQIWQTDKAPIKRIEYARPEEDCNTCEYAGTCSEYQKDGICQVYDEEFEDLFEDTYDEDGEEYE